MCFRYKSVLNVGTVCVFKLKMNISLKAIVAILISQITVSPFFTVSHYAPEKR